MSAKAGSEFAPSPPSSSHTVGELDRAFTVSRDAPTFPSMHNARLQQVPARATCQGVKEARAVNKAVKRCRSSGRFCIFSGCMQVQTVRELICKQCQRRITIQRCRCIDVSGQVLEKAQEDRRGKPSRPLVVVAKVVYESCPQTSDDGTREFRKNDVEVSASAYQNKAQTWSAGRLALGGSCAGEGNRTLAHDTDRRRMCTAATCKDLLEPELLRSPCHSLFPLQRQLWQRGVQELKTIFAALPKKRQTLLFSATITATLEELRSVAMTDPFFYTAPADVMPQRERLASLNMFKSNTTRVLVATDVASRGLDIPSVELVLNHNVPSAPKDYVHRVGRTARAGRGGKAITLVTQHDVHLVEAIEALIKTKLALQPTKESEVLKILTQVSVALREAEIRLDEQDFEERKLINWRKKLILQGLDPDEVEAKKRKKQQQRLLQRKRKGRRLAEGKGAQRQEESLET
ncbi:hypothetical protein HPB52_024106 [Rhipicephalus sanguineus]|uniref:Helicase C-terminal domain-containing protein n=1 Tax=Rhipicephalus sanguineus TaxID=34632 RepID=A0A9D4SVB8_RHISA|nr:hypothetical protein HPB52_024106 [Rhipicephalus sanguineus]